MATVHLKDWIMLRANQSLPLKKTQGSPHIWKSVEDCACNMTAPWNQPPLSVFVSLSKWHCHCCWQTLSCVWSCAQCHPQLPPSSFKISQSGADCVDTVGCHTMSHCVKRRCQCCICCICLRRHKETSLCWLHLFVWQPAWLLGCVVAKWSAGSVGAHATNKPNPPSPGKEGILSQTNMHLRVWLFLVHTQINTHPKNTLQADAHLAKLFEVFSACLEYIL